MYEAIALLGLEETELTIQRRELRDCTNVLELPDADFVQDFRVDKEIFEYIFEDIKIYMKETYYSTHLLLQMKLATFLRFLATGNFQKLVGNKSVSFMAQTTVAKVIAECLSIFENNFCQKLVLSTEEGERERVIISMNQTLFLPIYPNTHTCGAAKSAAEDSTQGATLSHCNATSFFHHGSAVKLTTRAATATTLAPTTSTGDIVIGPCRWVIDRKCPDTDVKFFLYTRRNLMDRQNLHVDTTLEKSNITSSYFNPRYPTKIIVHGYNSDMFLHSLFTMREEYLARDSYNIIYVDWAILSPGPCYLSAVHNTKHAGACVAMLVERILEMGSTDIHVIGFSLGAQLTNYIAKNLGSYKLPRITGLDPAMPLFITASDADKLDPTDASYVDVIHTNALVQGKIERCGHVDFYMNGGIMQPGCNVEGFNTFACSHQRAADYFLESIRSPKGFWGWACSSYISYLLGMCPATNYLVEAGDHVSPISRGMYLVETNDTSPYALGKWTDLPTLGKIFSTTPLPLSLTLPPLSHFRDPLLKRIDQWNKLESSFNNLEEQQPTPYSQDPNGDNWTYFSGIGTGEITNKFEDGDFTKKRILKNESAEVDWNEYRKNLTIGHIENSIFKVPQIKKKVGAQRRQPRNFRKKLIYNEK